MEQFALLFCLASLWAYQTLITKRKASIVVCILKYSCLSRQTHHLRHSTTWLGCQIRPEVPAFRVPSGRPCPELSVWAPGWWLQDSFISVVSSDDKCGFQDKIQGCL